MTSRELNAAIRDIPMPERIKKLPISDRGYPVPWFVPWQDGKPMTQAANPMKNLLAHKKGKCWCCAEAMGTYKAFVIGPMCMINRISSEPPSHRECAEYTVRTCPFLTKPAMKRNPADVPGKELPAGYMIERNPGVCLIWITKTYEVFEGLYHVGEPLDLSFWREGRPATRDEIMHSIETGIPLLKQAAALQGREALRACDGQIERALKLVPTLEIVS
jgi:hypothetical protein